jgi:hypothetical protein
LYLPGVLDAINFYTINNKPDEISLCRRSVTTMAVLPRMNELECFRTNSAALNNMSLSACLRPDQHWRGSNRRFGLVPFAQILAC